VPRINGFFLDNGNITKRFDRVLGQTVDSIVIAGYDNTGASIQETIDSTWTGSADSSDGYIFIVTALK